MPRRDQGPSVKDPETCEPRRDERNSKKKAARVANSSARNSRATNNEKFEAEVRADQSEVDPRDQRA